MTSVLTIAQITDLHITSAKDPANRARNAARLHQVLKAIHALRPRPLAIFASGDLVDRGEPEEYAELQAISRAVEIPLHFGLGNHDRREAFRAAFPSTPVDENGFVQYAVAFEGLRVIMCDTLDETKTGGGFCASRANWLRRTLGKAPDTPTLIFLHHPPIPSGILWMDEPPDAEWMVRLGETVQGARQIRTLACGHMHRAYHGLFAGQAVAISSATAIQLTLDLTPVDMRVPDGREILNEEPPGYTIFAWDKTSFAAHACVAGDFSPAVTYDHPFVGD